MPAAPQILMIANLALVLWTLAFGFSMAFRRVSSVKAGKASGAFYVTYNQGQEPDNLAVLTRHYANLHENPVLFYVVSALCIVSGAVDMTMALLGCAYVAGRVIHTLVHITFNAVLVRFAVFVFSNVMLTIMAVRLLLSVL